MNKFLASVILISILVESALTQGLPLPQDLAAAPESSQIAKEVVKAAVISGIIPGGAQFMQKRYFISGTFLAFEAVSGAVAYHYRQNNKEWLDIVDEYRADAMLDSGRDSAISMEESFIAQNTARLSRYRMYNALSLAVGGYIYNILDAVDGGLGENQKKRNPAVAGWLAAIPAAGLGQIYNGKISKAGLFIMGQVSLGVLAFNNHRLMHYAEEESARLLKLRDQSDIGTQSYDDYSREWSFKRDSAFRKRNTYLWYSLILYFVNIFDAVVDAHLADYGQKMKVYPDLSLQSGGTHLNLNVNF